MVIVGDMFAFDFAWGIDLRSDWGIDLIIDWAIDLIVGWVNALEFCNILVEQSQKSHSF